MTYDVKQPPSVDRRFCIAPMMDWSDRHCRFLWRLISKYALLYTEMVTTGALLHGDQERFLEYDPSEHPVALQLGGSSAKELARCAQLAERWGYDEVNLNCGCPSDRVQAGKFGACLMAEPRLVADGIKAMQDAVSIPITVKHRVGIDDSEDYASLIAFIEPIVAVGCKTFIVHARKAWLEGLNPKENREIPPLNYAAVYRLKRDFPDLDIVVNGGITTLQQCQHHLQYVSGVMLGREAYNNPYMLSQVDRLFYNKDAAIPSREQILHAFIVYCEAQISRGIRLHHMSRHILGLLRGVPGARHFRRHISENAHKPNASIDILRQALDIIKH